MLRSKGINYVIRRESWESAQARGMCNPGRVIIFRERVKGRRVACRHRFYLSAGDFDDIDVLYCTESRRLFAVTRNTRYGYAGVEQFDCSGEDDTAERSIFEQNNPEVIWGRNWEDSPPRSIVNRSADYLCA